MMMDLRRFVALLVLFSGMVFLGALMTLEPLQAMVDEASSQPAYYYYTSALTADFAADITQGQQPLTVHFTDLSIPGDSLITAWQWDFGNGYCSAEQNPVFTYMIPGIYSVSLTVTDAADSTAFLLRADYITVLESVNEITLLTSRSMDFGSVYTEEQSDYQAVIISNTGNVDLLISSLHFQSDQLHFSMLYPEPNLILEPGETEAIMVRFEPQAMGSLADTLYIVNDSANEPLLQIALSGFGVAVAPQAPQNLLIDKVGNDILLSWDPVTLNVRGQPLTPDFYFVYISGDPLLPYSYHGLTADSSYIYANVHLGDPRLFYKVTAVKLYREGDHSPAAHKWLSCNLLPGISESQVLKLLRTIPGTN